LDNAQEDEKKTVEELKTGYELTTAVTNLYLVVQQTQVDKSKKTFTTL